MKSRIIAFLQVLFYNCPMNILIRAARVMDPLTAFDRVCDLLISDGKVQRIEPVIDPADLPPDTRVISANGLIAAPGLIDIHVHFREPGFTHKEDIDTGADAAVAGGYTTVVMMANTRPVIDSADILSHVMNRITEVNRRVPLHILPTASVTVGLGGKELTDFAALSDAGAAGFTDDGIPILDEALLKQAFSLASRLHKPVSLHEEDPALITENGIHAGKVSAEMSLTGSPREAEISMIERDIAIASDTGCDVNIQHISTKEGVELVRRAKKQNPHIHAEATPHHFSLTEDAVRIHGTLAKMNPPLRTEEDRLAIIEGLRDNTIEIIATDHAPHAAEEKARSFPAAPSGIIGLETALPLGITNLVEAGHLSMMQLLARMSTQPAALYGLPSGIAVGKNADLVLFDPSRKQRIESFRSRSANSPFTGSDLTGVVCYTICNGIISYEKE